MKGVSHRAIRDSPERFQAPNFPDTRKDVRQIILDWIRNEGSVSSESFLWLHGPARTGKTAILQAIAAEFQRSPSGSGQNFGGSFFFSRGEQRRYQGHFLLSMIANQLARNVPGLRQCVDRILKSDPVLRWFTKPTVVQLQTVIVKAFKNLSPLPQRSYLVIIDGLDECHDNKAQQILRLLCQMITVHKLPLRFLIGSRPESHIRASFDQESLNTITHRVETFNPGGDIEAFLRDGFAKICAESSSIMSLVEQPWPSEDIIDLLVQRSSGQFNYAETVLEFVGADLRSPTKQLEQVLKSDPTALSYFDQLHNRILSVYPSNVNIVEFIAAWKRQRLKQEEKDLRLAEEKAEAERRAKLEAAREMEQFQQRLKSLYLARLEKADREKEQLQKQEEERLQREAEAQEHQHTSILEEPTSRKKKRPRKGKEEMLLRNLESFKLYLAKRKAMSKEAAREKERRRKEGEERLREKELRAKLDSEEAAREDERLRKEKAKWLRKVLRYTSPDSFLSLVIFLFFYLYPLLGL